MEKGNSQCEHGQPLEQILSITTPVSLLANESHVQSLFHGQVSMAADNQIYVILEAMNGFKNLKIY